jgi:hypothetical protein
MYKHGMKTENFFIFNSSFLIIIKQWEEHLNTAKLQS